jgi:Putative beta-barrel porin-2, OmpL-like. bbp2
MRNILLLIACFFAAGALTAQQDSSDKKDIVFSGYAELYYGFDAGRPTNHLRPGFVYNHKRHNEVNVNIAMAKAAFTKKNYRANLAFMAGNYAQYNLAAEPTFAQFIYEANAGVKLSGKKEIWLDAGILPSHIGFESAIGADCWTLTRSLCAENSPYYEAGIKLSATSANGRLNSSFLVLNGWQKIQRPDNINRPSFGMQFNFKASDNLLLNYSNFIGSDKPDSLDAWRFFHNVYAIYEKDQFGLIIGTDVGTDRTDAGSYGLWFSPVIITRFKLGTRKSIALRAEYFGDKKQLIVGTGTLNGFTTFGTSVNYDIKIGGQLLWRIEAKYYRAKDRIFTKGSTAVNDNFAATTSLSLKL